jgi:hypothetical protein
MRAQDRSTRPGMRWWAILPSAGAEGREDRLEETVSRPGLGPGAIAQAVNNRQRSFADVLELVQQAQKFKDWLRKQGPSADLSEEYCREVSRLDWADKLPPKAVRWLLVNVAGLAIGAVSSPTAAVLTSLGISAADAFFLDKLLRGWRPNQFIEGPLKSFIRTT